MRWAISTLGGLAEAEEVEGVAEAQVILDYGGDDVIGDVLEIGQGALRDVEEDDHVGGVGVAPGACRRPERAPAAGARARAARQTRKAAMSRSQGRDALFGHDFLLPRPTRQSLAGSICSTLYWNFRSWMRKLRRSPGLWLSSFLPRGER